jgi:putative protease
VRDWAQRGLVSPAVAGNLTTDFTAYTLNHVAAAHWAEEGAGLVTLSIEDDRENLLLMMKNWPAGDVRPQVIIFKDTPLFVAEACSLTALHGGCPGASVCGYRTLHIENSRGERFYAAHEGCKSIVYAEEPFSIANNTDELVAAGVTDFRVDFLTRPYTAERFAAIMNEIKLGARLPQTHSANFETRLL